MAPKKPQPKPGLSGDIREFVESLNARGVDYAKIGQPPNRIDVLTSIDGVTFDAVWAGRVTAKLDGLPVAFIGREELLVNKRAANRPKDQADVAVLESRPPRRRRLKKAVGRRPRDR